MSYPRRSEVEPDDRVRITAHRVACGTTGSVDDLPDFDIFCVAVGLAAETLARHALREVDRM